MCKSEYPVAQVAGVASCSTPCGLRGSRLPHSTIDLAANQSILTDIMPVEELAVCLSASAKRPAPAELHLRGGEG